MRGGGPRRTTRPEARSLRRPRLVVGVVVERAAARMIPHDDLLRVGLAGRSAGPEGRHASISHDGNWPDAGRFQTRGRSGRKSRWSILGVALGAVGGPPPGHTRGRRLGGRAAATAAPSKKSPAVGQAPRMSGNRTRGGRGRRGVELVLAEPDEFGGALGAEGRPGDLEGAGRRPAAEGVEPAAVNRRTREPLRSRSRSQAPPATSSSRVDGVQLGPVAGRPRRRRGRRQAAGGSSG